MLAENMKKIDNKCIYYGVKEVVISSIFVKEGIEIGSLIRKVNDELRVLCSIISNDNTTRKYLCGDGVLILASNIVNYLNEIDLGVTISKLD